MQNLLVTGGCGFVGSNFVRWALGTLCNAKIINLDKLTYAGKPENLKDVELYPRFRTIAAFRLSKLKDKAERLIEKALEDYGLISAIGFNCPGVKTLWQAWRGRTMYRWRSHNR